MILVSFSRFDRTRGAKDQIFRTFDVADGTLTLGTHIGAKLNIII